MKTFEGELERAKRLVKRGLTSTEKSKINHFWNNSKYKMYNLNGRLRFKPTTSFLKSLK